MSPQEQPKKSKAERTAEAREKARIIREAEQRRRKRNSWLIRGGVVVAAVAVVVVIALIVVNTITNNAPIPSAGAVPAGMNEHGGVVVGKDSKVLPPSSATGDVNRDSLATPTPLDQSKPRPTPTDLPKMGIAASAKDQPVQVVIYADYMCPICSTFEEANAKVLKDFANQGKITYEYRTSGLLDTYSNGTNYSSRASAAAACVVNQDSTKYIPFLSKLFENQPQENTGGLSNDQLKQYAKDLGVDISKCVDDRTFRPAVAYFDQQTTLDNIVATPTIYIDGKAYNAKTQNFADFQAAVQGAIDAKASAAA